VLAIGPDQFDFHWENLNNKINLLICGDCDQFCDVDNLIQKAQKNKLAGGNN
jgi:hypothetical protein